MLVGAHLREEGVEGLISSPIVLTNGLAALFQAIQLPAGIASLDTGLANMDGDAFRRGC